MMKIRQPLEGSTNLNIPADKSLQKVGVEGKGSHFLDKLRHLNSEQIRQRLDSLLQKIDEQGKVLQNTLSLRDLMNYKGLVKDFMGVVISQGYTLKEEFGWNQRGQSKCYSLLKKVDEKLEEVTQGLMDKESEQMDLLGKLGEIRGLLVDLYS